MSSGFFREFEDIFPAEDNCNQCGLFKTVNSPKMSPHGRFRKRILVVGEAPGEQEDEIGKPWQGPAGRLLQETLGELGIELFEDCLCVNAVSCRPTDKKGNNRAPTAAEIQACRPRLLSAITSNRPKVIVLLGNAAVQAVIGDSDGIAKWRGWVIPDFEFGAWLCPTFHPSFVLRDGGREGKRGTYPTWKWDLENISIALEEELPPAVDTNAVRIADSMTREIYDELSAAKYLAFDIETNGLSPYREGSVILTVALSGNGEHAYSMPFPKPGTKAFWLLRRLLEDDSIGKIAANLKFEAAWLSVAGIEVKNWYWDTVLAAHILDNRPGITGLKFQAYVHFGIKGYDDEVSRYTQSKSGQNNAAKLMESDKGRRSLLLYNGLDALLTYRLAMSQIAELKLKSRD